MKKEGALFIDSNFLQLMVVTCLLGSENCLLEPRRISCVQELSLSYYVICNLTYWDFRSAFHMLRLPVWPISRHYRA
jgi:hypothetical protein